MLLAAYHNLSFTSPNLPLLTCVSVTSQDFSEDTYRTLSAADNAVMLVGFSVLACDVQIGMCCVIKHTRQVC